MKFLKSNLKWQKVNDEWHALVVHDDTAYIVRVGANARVKGPPNGSWQIQDLGLLLDGDLPRKRWRGTKYTGHTEGFEVVSVETELAHIVGGVSEVGVVKHVLAPTYVTWTFANRKAPPTRTLQSVLKSCEPRLVPAFKRKETEKLIAYREAAKRKTHWYRRFKMIADAVTEPTLLEPVLRAAYAAMEDGRVFGRMWLSVSAERAMELVIRDVRAAN